MHPLSEFDPLQVRVLGVLMEKEQTTPDYYPLTVNAITNACNQKTNRFPVMEVSDEQVEAALDTLDQYMLVARTGGARADHWKHRADIIWQLTPRTQAVMTLLLLRGPQTTGELRSRSERMHAFGSVDEVEATLTELTSADEPLVRQLPRRPGQKESRWAPVSSQEEATEEPGVATRAVPVSISGLEERVARLEQAVERLENQLEQLRNEKV